MFEAARLNLDARGEVVAEAPATFPDLDLALRYIEGSPRDLSRPWVRDLQRPLGRECFAIIAGKAAMDSVVPSHPHRFVSARLRDDLPADVAQGFRPGQPVWIRYWMDAFYRLTAQVRPVFFVTTTSDVDRHIGEGSYVTLFDSALEQFRLTGEVHG